MQTPLVSFLLFLHTHFPTSSAFFFSLFFFSILFYFYLPLPVGAGQILLLEDSFGVTRVLSR